MRTALTRSLGLLFLVGLCVVPAAAEEPSSRPGSVEAVTLFRGQAQVTRRVEVEAGRGALEVVVGPLPERVDAGSLFAEAEEGVHVRAVRYRRRAVGEEPREQVREIDQEIEASQQSLREIDERLKLIKKNGESLERIDALLGPSAASSAREGQLEINAETITQLTLFAFEQRAEMSEQTLNLEQEKREINKALEHLQRQRNEVASTSSQYVHEAVLFLDRRDGQGGEVRLTYLVNGCGWSPAYNLRAAGGRQNAYLEFNAMIQQLSGEDWEGVELTLSTATPALSAAAPALSAFHVGLKPTSVPNAPGAPEFDLQETLSNTNAGGYGQAKQMQRAAQQDSQARSDDFNSNIRNSWRLNVAGNDIQLLENVLPPAEMERMRLSAADEGDEPSLTYRIDDPITLASRRDQQIVRVASLELPASTHHVAMPVLTSYVYREAELVNNGDTDLLGGPVSVYLDERFVGRTEVPTIARGQTFVVGLGADPQLRAEKRLVERTADIQGGNQVVDLHYELTLENFKAEPVTVRLKDRLPYVRGGQDLGVRITEMPTALSEDPVYLRIEKPRQILRWDVEVPAAAHGEAAMRIDYQYQIAYDKKLTLTNPLRGIAGGGGGGGGGSLFGDEGGESSGRDNTLMREFEAMERARLKQ